MPSHAGSRRRRAFLARMLHGLCDEIGVRDAGSEGDERGAALILHELSRVCDTAQLQPFAVDRWVLASPAHLSVGSTETECYPFYGSRDTSGGRLSGILRRARPEDALPADLDALVLCDHQDRPAAILVAGPFGPAVPRYDAALTKRGLPVVGVDQGLLRSVESGQGHAATAFLQFSARHIERAGTSNVVGILSGRGKGEVLLIAHRDTQYTSPGANDNGASLIVLLLLAGYFARRRSERTLVFLATGAEEVGCLGAKEYAARRIEQGSLGAIDLCLNFDSLTYGRHPQIYTPNTAHAASLAERFRAEDPASHPRLFSETDTLDGAPFAERGIPTIYLNSRGDDDARLRVWHRSDDLPATVDPWLVELSFRAISGFLEEVE